MFSPSGVRVIIVISSVSLPVIDSLYYYCSDIIYGSTSVSLRLYESVLRSRRVLTLFRHPSFRKAHPVSHPVFLLVLSGPVSGRDKFLASRLSYRCNCCLDNHEIRNLPERGLLPALLESAPSPGRE